MLYNILCLRLLLTIQSKNVGTYFFVKTQQVLNWNNLGTNKETKKYFEIHSQLIDNVNKSSYTYDNLGVFAWSDFQSICVWNKVDRKTEVPVFLNKI